MKKITKILSYYIVLLGGFAIFLGFVIIGGYYYPDEIQNFVNRYPYIFFPVLFGYFYVYISVLKKIVSTKEFKQSEEESRRKSKENRERNLKRIKTSIPILAIYTMFHLIVTICLITESRNGAKLNVFLEYWSEMVTVPFVLLFLSIYCYIHLKNEIEENNKQE